MLASFDQSVKFLCSIDLHHSTCGVTLPTRLPGTRPRALCRSQAKSLPALCASQAICSGSHSEDAVQPLVSPPACPCAENLPSDLSQLCIGAFARLSVVLPVGLLLPRPSWAEEATEATREAIEAAGLPGSPTDRLTAVLFTGSVVALGVITLGTIYLSLSQFIDSRNEKADLSKWTPEERNSKAPAKKQQPSTKRKQYVSVKGGGKGFGDFGSGEREF